MPPSFWLKCLPCRPHPVWGEVWGQIDPPRGHRHPLAPGLTLPLPLWVCEVVRGGRGSRIPPTLLTHCFENLENQDTIFYFFLSLFCTHSMKMVWFFHPIQNMKSDLSNVNFWEYNGKEKVPNAKVLKLMNYILKLIIHIKPKFHTQKSNLAAENVLLLRVPHKFIWACWGLCRNVLSPW